MTDQQRWDSLGIYGCACAHTPNLDRLGSEGVVFDACTVNNTICTPSRASLMTGRHLPDHGVHRHYASMVADGEDPVVLSRSGSGHNVNPHETDLITCHTVRDFRRFVY